MTIEEKKAANDELKAIIEENESRERILRQSLPPADYERWLRERNRRWGQCVSKIPFGKYRKPERSLAAMKKHLDEKIVGRDTEKTELMRKLAFFILNGQIRRPLLFVGPPGEGKSHFAQCLAETLEYPIKYIHIPSLNGALAISGTEQHYDNSRIGELMQTVIDHQTLSIVFVFDEIDKCPENPSEGSVEGTLLSLFDPLWNKQFVDRSLGFPVDLSHCVFICTANDIDAIADPLIDRMDVINFAPYTSEQILDIITTISIPKAIKASGLGELIIFAPDVAHELVDGFDFDSMRDYEKAIEALVDNASFELLMSGTDTVMYTVTVSDLAIIGAKTGSHPVGFRD